jgi:Ca2+/Na+ antiporter
MAMLAVALMVAFVIYLIVRLYVPTVNKTADAVVAATAKQALKQLEQVTHKRMSPVKRYRFTHRVIIWLKIGVSVMPVVIVLCVTTTSLISRDLAIGSMSVLSLWAVVCFGLSTLIDTHNHAVK